MTLPVLPNPDARRLFLHRHALCDSAGAIGVALAGLIDRLGFVQVDSIATVERAHHMILWARAPGYRPATLTRLLDRDRRLFEHWTHDAAILPVAAFPHWRHRFDRDRARLLDRWTGWQRDGFAEKFDSVLAQVARHGPVTSAEVGEGEARGTGGWWDWHPSKAALEYLWRVGELAVTRREGFRKVYDLTERVIPPAALAPRTTAAETRDWACAAALDRLGFATPGELAAFWGAVSPDEAKAWAAAELAAGRLIRIAVQGADGALRPSLARPQVFADAAVAPEPPTRLRILSPFDPALRDRARAERLFGFHYRIEVFVPEPKRRYGYYVFPLLEGARLVGRVDAKAHRDLGCLRVRAVWPEPGVRLTRARAAALDRALGRLAVFAGCDRVEYLPGWARDSLG